MLTIPGRSKEDPRAKNWGHVFLHCPSDIVLEDPVLCDRLYCEDSGDCAHDEVCCEEGVYGCKVCWTGGNVRSIFN